MWRRKNRTGLAHLKEIKALVSVKAALELSGHVIMKPMHGWVEVEGGSRAVHDYNDNNDSKDDNSSMTQTDRSAS